MLPIAIVLLTASAACFGQETIALSGGTIYADPESQPIGNGVVIVEGGRIVAAGGRNTSIPKKATVLDCKGATIVAGFWNSHAHFFELKWENAAAIPAQELGRQVRDMITRYGFTTVFDLGSNGKNTRTIRDRIQSGEVQGPGIRTTGEALMAPGAMPPVGVIRMLGSMFAPGPEVRNAGEAADAVRGLLADGAD